MKQVIQEEGSQEPTTKMTAHRAAFFMDRFRREEKLLGPNEKAAVDFVIAMLEAQSKAEQEQQTNSDSMYYLQDTRGYVGNCPLWWALNGNGYTSDLRKAQRYTHAEAMRQHRCRDTDLPWLCSEIDAIQRPTIDAQDMHKMRLPEKQRGNWKIICESDSTNEG
ncbi:hypothetical protein [Caudoviricetes sp.]|nr:hypothetical protein [Caudoviricetes sp.]